MLLPLLDVVFVGLVGTDPGHVETQLTNVLAEHKVIAQKIASADVTALARQAATSPAIIKKLHADGVVASEVVVDKGNHRSLVVVVYDGAGDLMSMAETPFSGKTLATADMAMIRDNLGDELDRLVAKKPGKKPAKKGAAPATPAPEVEDDPLHPAAAVTTATADPPEAPAVTATAPSAPHAIALRGGLGFGVMARSFSPGPAGVAAYDSSPVPSIRVDASVEPMPHLSIGASFERTLTMHTDLPTEVDPTSITRWETTAGYQLHAGPADITPALGLGRRVFNLISDDPKATPNGDYIYAIVGATATTELTPTVTLFGSLAFEPVVGGFDTIAMSLGSASRWAVDVGAGVEIRPAAHIYVRALADYQRFSWSWDMASDGGSDAYPAGAVQVGARY